MKRFMFGAYAIQVLFVIVFSHGACAADKPFIIGSDKQLFIDFSLVESRDHVELVMNPPVKCGPVLRADRPWENLGVGSYGEVMEDDGLYRMWYESQSTSPETVDEAEIEKGFTCYAVSCDGILWEKPVVGEHPFQGNMQNNIVFTFLHHGTVFKDPVALPGQRYKTIIYRSYFGETVHNDAAYSPDGIHDWTIVKDRMNFLTDSQNMAFWDDQRQKYVFYVRGWTRDVLRTVVRFETDNILAPWPVVPTENTLKKHKELYPVITDEAQVVLRTDSSDPRPSDYYNPCVVKYPEAPNVYFAFPSMFFHLPEPPMGVELSDDDFIRSNATEPPYVHIPQHYDAPASPAMERRNVKTRNSGFLDIRLCTSRDGITWDRSHRGPYVSLGSECEPDNGSIYMLVGMLVRGGVIYQYYTGNSTWHDGIEEQLSVIMRLEQRLDGFVSADAAYEGGEMVTKPLVFSGTTLHLNINTSAIGSAAVALLDENGRPFPGYDLRDCDVIRGNFIDKAVSWHDKSDVGSFDGKPVRLRIMMRDSKLFSLQFRSD